MSIKDVKTLLAEVFEDGLSPYPTMEPTIVCRPTKYGVSLENLDTGDLFKLEITRIGAK